MSRYMSHPGKVSILIQNQLEMRLKRTKVTVFVLGKSAYRKTENVYFIISIVLKVRRKKLTNLNSENNDNGGVFDIKIFIINSHLVY